MKGIPAGQSSVKKVEDATGQKKPVFKAIKNKNLISFADDEDGEDGEDSVLPPRRGIRAAHDAGSKTQAQKVISEESLAKLRKKREAQDRAKQALAEKVKAKVEAAGDDG